MRDAVSQEGTWRPSLRSAQPDEEPPCGMGDVSDACGRQVLRMFWPVKCRMFVASVTAANDLQGRARWALLKHALQLHYESAGARSHVIQPAIFCHLPP